MKLIILILLLNICSKVSASDMDSLFVKRKNLVVINEDQKLLENYFKYDCIINRSDTIIILLDKKLGQTRLNNMKSEYYSLKKVYSINDGGITHRLYAYNLYINESFAFPKTWMVYELIH
jgi:hypothetical protein